MAPTKQREPTNLFIPRAPGPLPRRSANCRCLLSSEARWCVQLSERNPHRCWSPSNAVQIVGFENHRFWRPGTRDSRTLHSSARVRERDAAQWLYPGRLFGPIGRPIRSESGGIFDCRRHSSLDQTSRQQPCRRRFQPILWRSLPLPNAETFGRIQGDRRAPMCSSLPKGVTGSVSSLLISKVAFAVHFELPPDRQNLLHQLIAISNSSNSNDRLIRIFCFKNQRGQTEQPHEPCRRTLDVRDL